jgi:hypothetical protein
MIAGEVRHGAMRRSKRSQNADEPLAAVAVVK